MQPSWYKQHPSLAFNDVFLLLSLRPLKFPCGQEKERKKKPHILIAAFLPSWPNSHARTYVRVSQISVLRADERRDQVLDLRHGDCPSEAHLRGGAKISAHNTIFVSLIVRTVRK